MYSENDMEVANQIRVIGLDDLEYPELLRQITDPPAQLYVRGQLNWGNNPRIAIVGTRKPTNYGVQITTQVVDAIASHAVIISGLAYGVDSYAHQTAVKKGGITVAVLGCGLDDESIYPASNRGLAQEILRTGGALISEYPAGTPPLPHHFPCRNRIIAGLSEKVVVIEASEGSGALITARLALDYNREVLAVPGMVTNPNAWGPNRLIAEGARPVLSPDDVVEIAPEVIRTDLTEPEEKVYNTLKSGAMTVDEIAQQTNLVISEINIIVTLLEMRGIIVNTGSGTFGIK